MTKNIKNVLKTLDPNDQLKPFEILKTALKTSIDENTIFTK